MLYNIADSDKDLEWASLPSPNILKQNLSNFACVIIMHPYYEYIEVSTIQEGTVQLLMMCTNSYLMTLISLCKE